ncbi:phosphonate metabolism protein/1,5-bisphosphokinase (PRPP-forming) PhnN [Salipiger pallidus]|nr:phosphonate metabolism protein/1,5-bisphosphokinase (PRPP-forming) PhnN [Salipiger pallidus]
MSGRLYAVVGPSGVGKDTLMAEVASRLPVRLVRRVITRPASAGGEDFDGVSEARFAEMSSGGAFALEWRAHGLRYGVPAGVEAQLGAGEVLLCNLSRAVLPQAAARFPGLEVLHITARPEVLAERLAGRGRESEGEIAGRLARAGFALPEVDAPVHEIDNSGPVEDAVAAIAALVQPVSL